MLHIFFSLFRFLFITYPPHEQTRNHFNNSVDFSRNQKQLVSASADGAVMLWTFKPQVCVCARLELVHLA